MIEPGIYHDLSNDAYHGEPDYLSSSYLKSLIPERYSLPNSRDALDFGTAFHTRALGTDEHIVVVDAATWRGKAAAEEREAAWAKGAVPILADDSDRIDGMVKALRAHESAARLLDQASAQPEVSVFAEDTNGVRHKARFDLLADVAVDLKSTSAKPSADELAKTVINYGYDLSAAHYLTVAELAGLDITAFALIFVAKTEPYRVTVAELDDTFLTRGRVLRALAIERHLNPAAPRYEGATGYLTLSAPRWAQIGEAS